MNDKGSNMLPGDGMRAAAGRDKGALFLKKTAPAESDSVDRFGVPKAKIFDQIDPKNNGPQRSNKLGY